MNLPRFLLLLLVIAQSGYAQKIVVSKRPLDSSYVFRGLSVVDDNVAWLSGKNGVVGKSVDGGERWVFTTVKGGEKMDFRTLYAFNAREAVIANAGAPAYIMRTSDGGVNWNIVYTNSDSLAFIDGVDFWNDNDGIMYGDPIDHHMLLLRTADGGKTWHELPIKSRPVLEEGEASFAASGTGIRCYGENKVVISTGGLVSRLLVSDDRGKNWKVLTPPIMHGLSTTGIFSLAFVTGLDGVIVGGDYKNNTLKENHVFYTRDGGQTWKAPEITTGGQRECVEFITKDIVLATGVTGMDVSYNKGVNWSPVEDQTWFATIRKARKGRLVVAAGRGRLGIVSVE